MLNLPDDGHADGAWGAWHLETQNGHDGVHWVEAFKPVYFVGKAGGKAYHVASSVLGRLNPWSHRKRHLAEKKSAANSNGSGAELK